MSKIGELLEGTMGIAFLGLYILMGIGELYWLWMSIHLGSFMMFVVGLFPPLFLIAAPVGAWSLLFGIPVWVVNVFG